MSQLISVLIPAYRAERYVQAALDSVAAQIFSNWEVRIHEDGITDNTARIVEAFSFAHPGKVFHSATPRNQGVSATRNRLMDEAKGDFIAFLDADDTWEPDHLSAALEAMKRESADWFVAGMNEVTASGTVKRANVCPPRHPLEELPKALLAHNFIPTTFVVLHRKIVDAGFRFDPGIVVGEDLDLWLRILGAGFVPAMGSHATVNYRRHESNTTNDTIRFHEEFTRVFEKHLRNPGLPDGHCLRGVRMMLWVAIRMTWRRQPLRAVKSLGRICRAYRVSFLGR